MQLLVNRGKHQGAFILVTGETFTIGRDETCQLRPRSDEVSRRHAELKLVAGRAVIRDLGSQNGTQVNGQPLISECDLQHGDRIEIGPLSFTVVIKEVRRGKPSPRLAEDDVATWLISEVEDPSELSDLEVPAGDTKERGVVPSPADRAGDPRRTSAPDDRDSDASDLLRSMRISEADDD